MKIKRKTLLALLLVAALIALLAFRLFFYASPVAVIQAEEGEIALEVRGPGVVTSRIQVTVSTRITGILKELHADQGDSVKAGQLLALLDDTDTAAKVNSAVAGSVTSQRNIAAADAALAKARADRVLAQSNYERDQEVFRPGYISQAEMDATAAALKSAQSGEVNAAATLAARRAESQVSEHEAVYARALHAFTRITAPMDGLIVARDGEVGNTVVPGSSIFRMVDTHTLWVAARIDESVVGLVEVGQPATIRLRSNEELPGEVARINLQSDAATRELEVNVAFRNIPQRFAINQEAEVVIHAGEEKGIVIPASALFQQGHAFGVLTVVDGRAEFRPVQTGTTDSERAIVRKGLKVDEMVIHQPAGIRIGNRVRALTAGDH